MSPAMIPDFFQSLATRLTAIRHQFHVMPELSRAEEQTSRLVAQELRELNLSPVERIGGYGVVAAIHGRTPGCSVALRAEMDALPIRENTGLAYASRNSGRMHACGHDGHMTMLLGAAAYLAKTRDFPGTVYLIFQPAEERFGGAQAMIDDGLLQHFPFDSIFCLHNWPGLAAGEIVVHDGPVMAGTNEFEIVFTAPGAHGAMPHLSGDPILAGGYFLTAVQQIVSRSIDPLEPAVITIGSFNSGAAQNVIPREAKLTGTYRSFSTELLAHLSRRLEVAVHGAAATTGVVGTFSLDGADYPPVINSSKEATLVRGAAANLFGAARLSQRPPAMTGDDFGIFTAHKPGVYVWIGNGMDAPGLHQPEYNFNDEILTDGARLLASIAETVLRNAR